MENTGLKETNKQYTKRGLLRYFLKGSVALFLFAVACGMIMTFLSVVIPKIIGFTIDSVIGDAPPPASYSGIVELFGGIAALKDRIWIVAIVIIGIALIATVFKYCSAYFITAFVTEKRLGYALRTSSQIKFSICIPYMYRY